MEHSRARSVAREGFPRREQYEGTTVQTTQVEEPQQSCEVDARQKFEIEENFETPQDAQSARRFESRQTEDRLCGLSRPGHVNRHRGVAAAFAAVVSSISFASASGQCRQNMFAIVVRLRDR
jgi:hypothetical protein